MLGLNIDASASLFDVIMQLCQRKEFDKLATFCSLLWSFWYQRNKMEFVQLELPPLKVAEHALGILRRFKSLKGQLRLKVQQSLQWSPPPTEYLKLNTDGALFNDVRKAGIGAILRDDKGKVVMAASMATHEVDKPETIELLVVFRGMQLCIGMGIRDLIVESDCLLLVDSLQKNDMLDSASGSLFAEVICLQACFVSCSYTHVYREGNVVAHRLSRHAWNVENIEMWGDCIPNFLSQALWLDKCL